MAAALAVVVLVGATACSPTQTRSIGVDAADVATVDLYFYDYGSAAATVTRTTITDAATIEELVHAFTDMPVQGVSALPADARGAAATGLRFTRKDGTTAELTQVFVFHDNVTIVWGDGTMSHTKWGAPMKEYFLTRGPSTEVDSSERPATPTA